MSGYVEMHCHLVYGVDDGAQTKETMEKMLDAAYADGVRTIFCTPHISPGLRTFDRELYEAHFTEARQYCERKGYGIALLRGAEILCTPMLERYANEQGLPTLGDSYSVLIEFMPDAPYREIENAVSILERAGYLPVLAHMERYSALMKGRNARRLRDEHEIRCQVNAGTVIDGKGFFFDRRVGKWLDEMLIDYISSDAHDDRRRPFHMDRAYQELLREYDRAYADRLVGLTEPEDLLSAADPQDAVW